jgi:alpha-galactosidase/6-phospho-beta-glucosidase family protein
MPAQAARWTLPHIYNNELIIEAAVEGSREKAIQAFASDHMIRDFHEAVKVFDALVDAHGDRLKKFKKKASSVV